MANDLTVNDVLWYLTSVRITTPTDNFILKAVAFYTSKDVQKAKGRPVTNKACISHPNPSTEDIKDSHDLIERKPSNIE